MLVRGAGFFQPKAKAFLKGRKDILKNIAVSLKGNQSPLVWLHCASLGEFEQGKPLLFGEQMEKGIHLDGLKPVIVNVNEEGVNDLWVHDEQDKTKANLLSRFFDHAFDGVSFPRPFGVIYAEERPVYEEMMAAQIETYYIRKGKTALNKILSGDKTWNIL